MVLVVVDTLRADAVLGAEGAVRVPNLAALAEDGVVFPRSFAHYPGTVPSHTSLFSSVLPHAAGVFNNTYAVPADLELVTERLSRAGWATGAVLSLTVLRGRGPGMSLERGFDFYLSGERPWATADEVWDDLREAFDALAGDPPFFLFAHLSDPHEPYHDRSPATVPAEVRLNGEVVGRFDASGVGSWSGEVALREGPNRVAIEARRPLLPRTVAYRVDDHVAYGTFARSAWVEAEPTLVSALEVPEDWPSEGSLEVVASDDAAIGLQAERYAREVTYADDYLGRLLELLVERGVYEETLVVFTSDHGEAFEEHGNRAHGFTLFDEELHVPLVIKLPAGWPEREGLAAVREDLVRHVDLAPTLLDLLDLAPLERQQGTSLLAEVERGPLLAETHVDGTLWALRDERYKLIHDVEQDSFQMYDLEADPAESEDRYPELAGRRPGWTPRLRELAELFTTIPEPGQVPSDVRAHLEALGYF